MPRIEAHEVCFVGLGRSVPCWYRVAVPATALGCDWVGSQGDPPNDIVLTGNTTNRPSPDRHKIIVLQQPQGPKWAELIRAWQAAGVVVLYEIDDYVHGARYFVKEGERVDKTVAGLRNYEMCMRACDGLIVSTDYLRQQYAKYNSTVWLCENGIDLGRYHVTRPQRETPTVGWFGGQGHERALHSWLPDIKEALRARPGVRFAAIGQQYEDIDRTIPPESLVKIPFTHIENVPGVLANVDIAVAPAEDSDFFRAKSDLRFLEAGASSLAGVYDAQHYVIPEDCGFAALHTERTERIIQLIDDHYLRERMGKAARKHVEIYRSDQVAVDQWVEVFNHYALEAS